MQEHVDCEQPSSHSDLADEDEHVERAGLLLRAAWPSGRARDSSYHSWLALEPSMALASFSLSLLIQVHEAARLWWWRAAAMLATSAEWRCVNRPRGCAGTAQQRR